MSPQLQQGTARVIPRTGFNSRAQSQKDLRTSSRALSSRSESIGSTGEVPYYRRAVIAFLITFNQPSGNRTRQLSLSRPDFFASTMSPFTIGPLALLIQTLQCQHQCLSVRQLGGVFLASSFVSPHL